MVLETPPARIVVSQWASIVSVAVAAFGLLWGAMTYFERFVARLDNIDDRLMRLERLAGDNDVRSRMDHDAIVQLQTTIRLHLGIKDEKQ